MLENFLPHYLNFDWYLKLPKEYEIDYKTVIPGLEWNFRWENIKYEPFDIKMQDLKFEIVKKFDFRLINFNFPEIKHWEIKTT